MFKRIFMDKSTNKFVRISFGNILEWYDFSIYSLLTIPISKAFFPESNHAILLTLFTFGAGFISRPLGSLIFGYIGDVTSKNRAVNLAINFMAFPTMLIGLLPEYQQIGLFAPVLLFILRIMQGLSAGGQFSGLITIAVDSNAKRQSFLTSIIYTISIVGTLFASFSASISLRFIHSNNYIINSLSWRLPFIFSGILFIIYKIIAPKHNQDITNRVKFSFFNIVKNQGKELINATLLAYTTGTLYFILFSYFFIYIQIHLAISKATSLIILNFILISSIVLFPIFGHLADKTTNRFKQIKLFIFGFIGGVSLLLFSHVSLIITLLSLAIMLIFFCAIIGYTTSLFAEIFTKEYRMTACSIAFNIGIVFSGFSPFFSEALNSYKYLFQLFIFIVAIVLFYTIHQLAKTSLPLKEVNT